MQTNLKLEIVFQDRLGIVADVAAILASRRLNIVSMEVQKKGDRAYVYLEVEHQGTLDDSAKVFSAVRQLAGCLSLAPVHTLPQETREKSYRVVLDSVSDGILSVNEKGVVTTVNRVARKILGLADRQVVGMELKDLELADQSLDDCLAAREHISRKVNNISARGRFQYLATCKPIRDSAGRMVGAVEIMKDMQEIEALVQAVSEPGQITFSDIVGKSLGIREVISIAQKIADTESVVSIRGESGTGKELFARAIHFESRRKGPFVPINCAALPESLLESELFGYVGGAFTGASRRGKPGLFEIAQGGSVFLDEIADMSLKVQAKILRLIQEKKVRRIGGAAEIPIDARVITATNRNLERLVEEKLFREDLYYRINVLPIHIPPLRRRPEDIKVLADHFLFQLGSRLKKDLGPISTAALEKLMAHAWPGNVRELKNVIERAAILAPSGPIGQDSILFSFELASRNRSGRGENNFNLEGKGLRDLMAVYEKKILIHALNKAGSIRQAARRLGISHTTLLNKIQRYNLSVARK